MSEINYGFSRETNWVASDICKALVERGVDPYEMDIGYSIANYNGKLCPDTTDRTCFYGFGDGVLDAEEVIEYAFNDHKTYQTLIEGVLGRPLPNVLDDLDPKTTFDADVRKKADALIDVLGVAGSKNRHMIMMVLLAFTSFPIEMMLPLFDAIIAEKRNVPEFDLKNATKVRDLLAKEGTFKVKYVKGEPPRSALQALKDGRGDCIAQSNILFALLDRAGFSPFYIFVDPSREKLLADAPDSLEDKHVCVGVNLNGKIQILDPLFPKLLDKKTTYDYYIPLSLRQYVGATYINDSNAASLDTALLIDDQNPYIHLLRSLHYYANRDFDMAIDHISESFRRLPDSKMRLHIDEYAFKRWNSSPEAKALAEKVTEDCGIDAGQIDFGLMMCVGLARSGRVDDAAKSLFGLLSFVSTSRERSKLPKASTETIKYFQKWLDMFPANIKDDPRFIVPIQKLWKSLR